MPDLELWFGSEDSAATAPKDSVLTARTFAVQERVSGLFEVAIMARVHDAEIDLETLVGQPAGFRVISGLLHASGGKRHWKGICRYLEQSRVEVSDKGLSTYQLFIVPALWLLTQRRGNRIFQHQTIPDIVDTLLGEWQIEPTWQIDRGAYPKLEYRVQYGETDYAFFCRLLEEAGIAFTFPDAGLRGSELTLSDKLTGGDPHPASPFPFVDAPNEAAQREYLSKVQMSHGVRPGALSIRDYGFRNPDYPFLVEAPPAKAPEAFYEQYQYRPGAIVFEGGAGGDTPVADDLGVARPDETKGRARATRELVAERAGKRQIAFETNIIDLLPGVLFAMARHSHPALAPGHLLLVTELYLNGSQGGPWSMSGKAFFAEDPFAPALATPRPRALGMESAKVVGPPGEEIYVDEFGRVRVQFPWDREGTDDPKSSCWMRVSQGWAGMGFGMMSLPRVGQEVLVGFLGGDPDQPIVVGRVFNGKNTVPYKLPDHKTVSTWKSSSSPGGDGFNELLFDDAKGNELVNVQAQKDLQKLVKNDETEVTQGHHQLLVVNGQEIVVKTAKKELIDGDSHLHVTNDQRRRVEGKDSLTVGGSRQEKIGQSLALEAGMEIHLKGGTSVVIEAMNLTLKDLSGNFISIGPGGVDIVGLMVNINSGGSAGSGSAASPDTPDDATEAKIEPPGT